MEQSYKKDTMIGLSHMANILGPLILFGFLASFGVPLLVADPVISMLIERIIVFLAVLLFVYRSGKYINKKFEYQNTKQVVLISLVSFFIINLIAICGITLLIFMFPINPSDKTISDIFFGFSGLNNVTIITGYLVFYALYYILGIKGLKK